MASGCPVRFLPDLVVPGDPLGGAPPVGRGGPFSVGVEGGAVAEGLGHGEAAGVGVGPKNLEPEAARFGAGQADVVGKEHRNPVRLFEGTGNQESSEGHAGHGPTIGQVGGTEKSVGSGADFAELHA